MPFLLVIRCCYKFRAIDVLSIPPSAHRVRFRSKINLDYMSIASCVLLWSESIAKNASCIIISGQKWPMWGCEVLQNLARSQQQ